MVSDSVDTIRWKSVGRAALLLLGVAEDYI